MNEYSDKDYNNVPTATFCSENSSKNATTNYCTIRNSYDLEENLTGNNFFHLTDTNSKSYDEIKELSFSGKLKAFKTIENSENNVRPFDDFLQPIF